MPLTLIDRFHPHLCNEQQEAINNRHIRKLEEVELLEPEHLRPLALLSMILLLIGAIFFGLLNYISYTLLAHSTTGIKSILLWIVINIIGYILILPIHELIHAAAFLLWGGKPYFGAKLPYALYCGAKNQLFRRNQYFVVGLAPLVVITLAGFILILLSPVIASYTLFALIGNFSGAAGDIWVVRRLSLRSPSILVEDTESGYRAWELTEPAQKLLKKNSHIVTKNPPYPDDD